MRQPGQEQSLGRWTRLCRPLCGKSCASRPVDFSLLAPRRFSVRVAEIHPVLVSRLGAPAKTWDCCLRSPNEGGASEVLGGDLEGTASLLRSAPDAIQRISTRTWVEPCATASGLPLTDPDTYFSLDAPASRRALNQNEPLMTAHGSAGEIGIDEGLTRFKVRR